MTDRTAAESRSDQATAQSEPTLGQQGLVRTSWRWFKRVCGALLLTLLAYAVLILIGLYPVNSDFVPDENGIEVFVFSGEFHSDIVLPVVAPEFDWRSEFPAGDFSSDTSMATHVAVGWGERDFYLHTPTWADLKVSTACSALLIPSDTVMHVAMVYKPLVGANVRRVRVSGEQYLRMVEAIKNSFERDANNQIQKIPDYAYSYNDSFYDGVGSYHMFRTCNCWAGEVMKAGGIKVGWFTPLPKTVFAHLPEQE